MRKLTAIIAVVCLFFFASCVKNAKVNMPKASPEAKEMAQKVADYVVRNGVEDPDCEMFEKCHMAAVNLTSKDGRRVINNQLKVKEKFGKRTLGINRHSVVILREEDGQDYKYEGTLIFLDKKTDGVVDYLSGIINVNGETFFKILYENGAVVEGMYPGQFQVPQDIYILYESVLMEVTGMVDVLIKKLRSNWIII